MSFSSTSCWCQGAIFLKKGSCFASHPYDLKTAIQPTNYNIKEPSYFCETQNHEHQMFTPSEDQSAVRQYYEQSSNDVLRIACNGRIVHGGCWFDLHHSDHVEKIETIWICRSNECNDDRSIWDAYNTNSFTIRSCDRP
ncbi:hypothetical protein QR680_003563 [Steinernema hermaphroditum]|uniref:Uncharacterized protein n=1 Tax=Steinernema hermaphroditum TaxID=289476 RepID=A0AA39HN49_9BILA|nr:hypothetical protein QR680_003563 [Steinernema hermaphroditum]